MTIDERLEALTMNLELAFRDIEALKEVVVGLVRIAEVHHERLTRLEGE